MELVARDSVTHLRINIHCKHYRDIHGYQGFTSEGKIIHIWVIDKVNLDALPVNWTYKNIDEGQSNHVIGPEGVHTLIQKADFFTSYV